MSEDHEENLKENILALFLIILIIAGIWWWAQGPQNPQQENERHHIPIGVSPSLGTPDAPVTVIEFSDFECPFCARFALQEFPRIHDRIESGQIEFVYKYFPLTQIHAHALLSAQAAACAHDQDMFWEYHDILYENQDALEINQLLSYGKELGLNMTLFESCVINEEKQEEILRTLQQGIDAGVTGTPTFFFNGRRVVGALSAEEFATEIERELAVVQE